MPQTDAKVYQPTPEQISAECEAIQATWTTAIKDGRDQTPRDRLGIRCCKVLAPARIRAAYGDK